MLKIPYLFRQIIAIVTLILVALHFLCKYQLINIYLPLLSELSTPFVILLFAFTIALIMPSEREFENPKKR